MKGWLAVIAGAISVSVLVLRWWLSDDQKRKRAFDHDEKERQAFENELAKGDLTAARQRWLRRMRQLQTLR